MKDLEVVLTVKHGSHLYGTSTPTSDTDYKGVHIPSGENIILQRAENVVDFGVKSKIPGTLKNAQDAIDHQSFSVQRFFEMLRKGDTVATEILFATEDAIVYKSPVWDEISSVGKAILNRECKGFVGYCIRQAAKYGIKGGRMSACRKVLDILEDQIAKKGSTAKLRETFEDIEPLIENMEHVSFENIPNPNGKDCIYLVCCDRKMPETTSLFEAIKVYQKVWDNYGERARQASDNQGVDWKAVSHAVRVAEQAVELLTTANITFPRPNAAFLTDIKLGKIPYKETGALLEGLLVKVQEASINSPLSEKSDTALAEAKVVELYTKQM